MIKLFGANALSKTQAENLAEILGVVSISARYIHFIDSEKLKETDSEKLKQLLDYGEDFVEEVGGESAIVIPRVGTISPWSSKATEIARNTGLDKIGRIERGVVYYFDKIPSDLDQLFDRMTEQILNSVEDAEGLFSEFEPRPLNSVDIYFESIDKINKELGLALSDEEINYLVDSYEKLDRKPTDAELMTFSQANSEHARHKVFNASWTIDGERQDKSLFQMIKNTHELNPGGVKSAYHDNGAVIEGYIAKRFFAESETGEYSVNEEPTDIVIKAETHNHPTAIAPFPGSGTGSGGEIRDEGATGRGAKPKAGLVGFSVSNLNIPGFEQPWEKPYGKPDRMANPLQIMTDGPLGAAAFNNEFGRTGLTGYFRTFETEIDGKVIGYHKPIMLGGGLANIRPKHVDKATIKAGYKIITIGGPAMLIGLGGSTASSQVTGAQDAKLDFASVQRQNPEMQRRAQEVINSCWSARHNPIESIHDVGAGGWSNALPELVADAGKGAKLELRTLPNAEKGMSPLEIWSNEAQERYVLAVAPKNLKQFKSYCEREKCPYAVLGEATDDRSLLVSDSQFDNNALDIPLELIFGNSPKLEKIIETSPSKEITKSDYSNIDLKTAAQRVLSLPAVASKSFLINIGDRTVGGLNVRDQMVGPWQVPVADVAVTASDFEGVTGEAMALGERAPIAVYNAAASGRMAIGELITNMVAAPIEKLSHIKLSANWMVNSGNNDQDLELYETVKAVAMEMCPRLGLTIPVGKDSTSMSTKWYDDGQEKTVTSPLSLVVSGFAPVYNTELSVTPNLHDNEDSRLLFIDLADGKNRMGASALEQVFELRSTDTPDVDNPDILQHFFIQLQELMSKNMILAYHDRSDGGLFTTIAEMCFAGRLGVDVEGLDSSLDQLFNEELGAVIQVRKKDLDHVLTQLPFAKQIGKINDTQKLNIAGESFDIYDLQETWSRTSYEIQRRRDNPDTAKQEFELLSDRQNPGLFAETSFEIKKSPKFSLVNYRPKVAILREQGVNGHVEMAAAFDKVGFKAVDVHMTDLLAGRNQLSEFAGLAAGGGFSYGDVLGGGGGWAKTILFHEDLKVQFGEFFAREDTFSLGFCNGCQMLSQIKQLIPGAENWPRFTTNESQRFEARLVMTEIRKSPSIIFKGMEGSKLPVPVAHGEGRTKFDSSQDQINALTALRYVDNYGQSAKYFPLNPNGSIDGNTGFTTRDGRATILMPHPERAFLTKQFSWAPKTWGYESPWLQLFANAREFVN
jgi:phosphoribosylformylglycinamidine synthase